MASGPFHKVATLNNPHAATTGLTLGASCRSSRDSAALRHKVAPKHHLSTLHLLFHPKENEKNDLSSATVPPLSLTQAKLSSGGRDLDFSIHFYSRSLC